MFWGDGVKNIMKIFSFYYFSCQWKMRGRGGAGWGGEKGTRKTHVLKLMQMDDKFYKIEGMETRAVSGNVKFGTTGLRQSPTLLTNYGFSQGDEFKVSCMEEGEIVLEKKYRYFK